jgi:hypothetical protein
VKAAGRSGPRRYETAVAGGTAIRSKSCRTTLLPYAAAAARLRNANIERFRNRLDTRSTTGDDLEVREFNFERHRSSPHTGAVAISPDLVDPPAHEGSRIQGDV